MNVTFNLNDDAVKKARERAQRHKTSLNALVDKFVKQYADDEQERKKRVARFEAAMKKIGLINLGKMPTRDELNSRK